MNTKEDIHREFFRILLTRERGNPHQPSLDHAAVQELATAARLIAEAHCAHPRGSSSIRRAAMMASVAAMQIVYSIDDALS